MNRPRVRSLVVAAGILLGWPGLVGAEEFPIAVGADSTFALSGAFDGTQYMVGIQGDATGRLHITAQRVSPAGALIGSRIALGRSGDPALFVSGPQVAFDGTHHLLVWTDRNGGQDDVYGQLVAPSGNLLGAAFPIAATAGNEYCCALAAGPTTSLVLWSLGGALYGQRVGPAGNLVGGELPIAASFMFGNDPLGETAVAFDGARFLVVWQDRPPADPDAVAVYGRFIDPSGAMEAPFLVSAELSPSYNPLAMAWNGSQYLVAWNRDIGPGFPAPTVWDLFGRLVSPAGAMGAEFAVTTASGDQILPSVASCGSEYLVTWTDLLSLTIEGRFFGGSGALVDTAAAVFAASGTSLPLGGVVSAGDQYLALATRFSGGLSKGDVYGSFLSPRISGIDDGHGTESRLALTGNRPNPFRRSTRVSFTLPAPSVVSLRVFDIGGREVATLVDHELRAAGEHIAAWDAAASPAGLYFLRLQVGPFTATKRIVRAP